MTRLVMMLVLLLASLWLSLMAGAVWYGPSTVGHALLSASPTDVQGLVIRTTRVPRTLVALVAGACLAVAGGVMQTLTRNPLASPGLLGVNAGALFVMVMLVSLWPGAGVSLWYGGAFAGAALAALLVWAVAMRGQASGGPLKLVLAGAAITALFTSFSQAMLVIDQQGLDTVLFWLAGSVAGRPLAEVTPLMGVALVALFACRPLARSMNVLAAGEAIARGVGVGVARLQLLMVVLVILLAGSSVAMAGNIAFVGLIVPHIARRLLPVDHRIWLAGCALMGATLLLLADVIGRTVILPREIPIGVMTALIGAPLFITLVRRQGGGHGRA
ncbi:FecCD family ABC transporter permease [Larsenimonas rhizosphaerae]|uniref:Iron ABC transporter permease n=1 Tax=Larsenimonas rhizosphaerae TaxID=2944682 RepID=A0AA42CY62_9GAMM|nr:iron ABC transporter permease [Larsenimonas rhizosphaerae]MCM2131926.1 iron ABC transporter permease [Larsenimonas rhizosphaerae]MCX2524768.1 iron ABC transporter permease [Larsenimonas rhizosphaerae]